MKTTNVALIFCWLKIKEIAMVLGMLAAIVIIGSLLWLLASWMFLSANVWLVFMVYFMPGVVIAFLIVFYTIAGLYYWIESNLDKARGISEDRKKLQQIDIRNSIKRVSEGKYE